MIYTGAAPEEIWPLVRDHHYSGRMPANIQHCYVARKNGGLFGDTGEPMAGIIFSLTQAKWSEEVLELSRLIRHPDHDEPLSKLISFACEWLRKSKWNMAISYADWTQRHHGGIYQAAGWLYNGKRDRAIDGLMINGQFKPGRSCNAAFGTRSAEKLKTMLVESEIEAHYDEGKHLYWKPFLVSGKTKAKRLGLKSLSYPKPNAEGPLDERLPSRASFVQPEDSAPIQAFTP